MAKKKDEITIRSRRVRSSAGAASLDVGIKTKRMIIRKKESDEH